MKKDINKQIQKKLKGEKMKITNLLLILFLCLGMVLAGCSPKSADDKKEPVEELPTFKVGYLPLVDHITLMVADGNDMFEGVNVEPIKFMNWPSLVEAMMSGELDGVHVINNLGVKMTLNGLEGKTVALSHRGTIGLVTSDDVNSAEDLLDSTIAVPTRFSPHYMMLHNYMAKNSMTVDEDYSVLDVAPPDFIATMVSGAVDGFIGSEPFPTIAEAKGVGKMFQSWDEMMIEGSNGLDCVVIFHDGVIAENPEAVQAYVDAIIEAGQLLENEPLEAATISSPYLLNQPPELIEKAITHPREKLFHDLMPRVSEYEALQDYAVNIGLLPEKIDLDEFVDNSYAVKAYAKLSIPMEE